MRIWLKPDVMAQYVLMPTDVISALAEQNIEAAPGQFGESGDQSFQYIMRYKGRLATPEEFEDIVIRATGGLLEDFFNVVDNLRSIRACGLVNDERGTRMGIRT